MARPSRNAPKPEHSSRFVQWAWYVAAISTVVIPLWVSAAGREAFRAPKILLFRGEGIVIAVLLGLAALFELRSMKPLAARRAHLLLPVAIAIWGIAVTIAAPDWRLSVPALITLLSGICIYYVALAAARGGTLTIAWTLLAAPLVNAVIALIQTKHDWNVKLTMSIVGDFSRESLARVSPVGLLGNRDDLGGFLVAPAVVAVALLVTGTRRRSAAYWTAAILLVGGVVASKTFTAIGALAVSLVLLAFARSWKAGAVSLLAAAIAVAAALSFYPPLAARTRELRANLEAGRYDQVVVGRLAPLLAGFDMARAHPLTGVGPGHFGREYYAYKIEAAQRHPSLVPPRGWIDYFTEAHDDYVQLAAEAGAPALLLFVAVLAAGASFTFRIDRKTAEPGGQLELARIVALPLFASLAILALAQYPLQLAATLQSYIVTAGMVAGWFDEAR